MGNSSSLGINFDDFLVERNDELDTGAYALALKMLCLENLPDNEKKFPWNMEIIGAILESAQSILEKHRHSVCWPYHEEEMPCYQTATCKKADCLLKGHSQKEGESNETN